MSADNEPRSDRRLPEIDRLRGLVMVLMALDHMRDFFDADAMRFSPTDLTRTYPLLFFTRFITHFCAPNFALLAGVGACLYGARINDPAALFRFLAARGLWLIFLDAVVVSPVWGGPGRINLSALWGIGCGLLILAPLSLLGARVALAAGLAIIAGHNLLDGVSAGSFGDFAPWWRLLHEQGALPFDIPGRVSYPALAWIGVVALGYGIGPVFVWPPIVRDRVVYAGAAAALALFVLLRTVNGYGDPSPWSPQRDPLFTLMSFLNVSKYPPSLLYLLVTLGGAMAILPLLRRMSGRIANALALFGRTPLFFYVLHLYLGIGAAAALAFMRGYRLSDIAEFIKNGPPPDFGAGLAGAWLAWLAVLIALYPLCRWFDALKSRRTGWWWLRYL